MSRSNRTMQAKSGQTLLTGIVARISGCAKQKEASLDDQVDHAKEEVAELYEGSIEYRTIATKGKGEALDRPELEDIEAMLRTGELDLLVMEDVGRLVRGAEAVRLWGIAVDHGTRCIAPNDCCDTWDDNWEQDLLEACAEHVGHNAHTSKRLKKKLMNRFKKYGQVMSLPIAGYIKPEGAKSYEDWRKDDTATETIEEGKAMLRTTLNGSTVALFFNEKGFSPGPYSRLQRWDGRMVLRYYRNRLLSGRPGRGFRCTIKVHERGRRVSVKNTEGEPVLLNFSHLAHLDPHEQDDLIAALDAGNSRFRRKLVHGSDPRRRVPRKRTRFPGQHPTCWYCGRHYVWGANGIAGHLACTGSRGSRCWNSIGIDGPLVAQKLVETITVELFALKNFDAQFAELVRLADGGSSDRTECRRKLQRDEQSLLREKENFEAAIALYGPRPMFEKKLQELDSREKELQRERYLLERLQKRALVLPGSVAELRQTLEEKFQKFTIESPEFGDLMRQLAPEITVYLVRMIDGGHLLPRAKVTLTLASIVPDMQEVEGLGELLTRELTLDLFRRPPQRERIREEAVRMRAEGLTQREIAAHLSERPKLPVVQQALAIDQQMKECGLRSPYRLVLEPPEDYAKLRRHKNTKFQFEPLDGYVRPPL